MQNMEIRLERGSAGHGGMRDKPSGRRQDLPPWPKTQFLSEEDTCSMIRGKGIAWSGYQATEVDASAPCQRCPGEFTPTEMLVLRASMDAAEFCTERNYGELMNR
jgi:hypothetical protein